jgi:ribosome biogenesis GTPase A
MGRKTAMQALQPHMRKALGDIQKALSRVDVVVEMRDARLPFASKNLALAALIEKKPRRILLLNKSDLASPAHRQVRPRL